MSSKMSQPDIRDKIHPKKKIEIQGYSPEGRFFLPNKRRFLI